MCHEEDKETPATLQVGQFSRSDPVQGPDHENDHAHSWNVRESYHVDSWKPQSRASHSAQSSLVRLNHVHCAGDSSRYKCSPSVTGGGIRANVPDRPKNLRQQRLIDDAATARAVSIAYSDCGL